ncbi:MAG: DUF3999 family protein [Caldimonas sp.]
MHRPESHRVRVASRDLASLLAGCRAPAVLAAGLLAGSAALAATPADAPAYRYAAAIEIATPAPFVQMALPPAAYAHAAQPDLRDLRIVDAAGERVPFALLDPTPAVARSERLREAVLFPLPPRPPGNASWPSPVEVTVDGDRITVRRSAAAGPVASPLRESPGWLIDLGELTPAEPAPRRLLLRWSGPGEFSAAYAIETSADMRSWRSASGGQVMSLQSSNGVLAQPIVGLPATAGRFVRLTWLEPATAPTLIGAASVAEAPGLLALGPANELVFAPSPAPAGKEPEPRGSLHFDLGGSLPLIDVELRFAAGTRVAPVRIQGRMRVDEPWRELASGVFYRIERDGQAADAPALALPTHARFIRFVPDERAAGLEPVQTRLVVHARLASLVFASSGQAPLRLLAGSADAALGALPAATLVPQFEQERKRFGQARLGAFAEAPEVARAAERAVSQARVRLGLLWAVLVIGVAVLGLLVWRLAKTGASPAPPP